MLGLPLLAWVGFVVAVGLVGAIVGGSARGLTGASRNIVLGSALVGTSILLAGTVYGVEQYLIFTDPRPLQDFDQNFPAHLARNPAATQLANQDPALRQEIFEKSRSAFIRGGWPAASASLNAILVSEIKPYADDDHILAAEEAESLALRRLRANPERCKAYVLSSGGPAQFPEAAAELKKAKEAYDDALLNGGQRRIDQGTAAWLPPTLEEEQRAGDLILVSPTPLTEPELEAFFGQSKGRAEELCNAEIKLDENYLALGHAGARAVRVQNFEHFSEQPPEHEPVPEGFDCATPGTKFVISTLDEDGKQVVQTSLGRDGFTCGINRSDGGDYAWLGGMIDTYHGMGDDAAIAALWPLAVGKKGAHRWQWNNTYNIVEFEVVGYGTYTVPAGTFEAYEIDLVFTVNNGMDKYRYREFWAPSLNWKIRHLYEAIRGDDGPNRITSDWDLQEIVGGERHAALPSVRHPG